MVQYECYLLEADNTSLDGFCDIINRETYNTDFKPVWDTLKVYDRYYQVILEKGR